MRQLKPNVYAVGAIDWDRRLFDELIPLPDGTSYNAYLIKGNKKTALLDTVDPTKTIVLTDNLIKLGDYQLGIRIYLEVYNDVKYRDDQRDDAIFKLGKTYESVLYEQADINKAIYYYEFLISEFPLSDRRLEAFQRSQLLKLQLKEREIYEKNNTTE